MKTLIRLFCLLSVLILPLVAKEVRVRGYTRKDGTYVAPHTRSSPNGTKSDNWSTKGNVNPYTGKSGTKSDSEPGSAVANPTVREYTTDATQIPALTQWRNIKSGISMAAVEKLLGKPKIVSNTGSGENWQWEGGGWVKFNGRTQGY